MIKIEHVEIAGLEPAIRGMRNPMNSWDKSDSYNGYDNNDQNVLVVGPNDLQTMKNLSNGGPVHGKFKRMIKIYMDITAPLYWWKEFDTYKVGTNVDSCSTMHKIHAKEFELDDFSYEHLFTTTSDGDALTLSGTNINIGGTGCLQLVINILNFYRRRYLGDGDKAYWWQMIQLLPSSYNQKRTVELNYEVATSIYRDRRNHKLDEWHGLCDVLKGLPHSELITEKPTYV